MKLHKTKVEMPEPDKGREQLMSLLRQMIGELSNGYVPDYLSLIYPRPDGHTETMMVFVSEDVRTAKYFDKIMGEMREEFRKQFLLDALGIEEGDLEKAKEQYQRDQKIAEDRAFDLLKKDKPITDTAQAEALLNKLMQEKDSDS